MKYFNFFNFVLHSFCSLRPLTKLRIYRDATPVPRGKEQVRAAVHELNAEIINKAVPIIKKCRICRLWLFLISSHNEKMLTSREHFAGTVLYFYYHITLLKHNLFFLSLVGHLWSV